MTSRTSFSPTPGEQAAGREEQGEQRDRGEVGDRGCRDCCLTDRAVGLPGVLENRNDQAQRRRRQRDRDQQRGADPGQGAESRAHRNPQHQGHQIAEDCDLEQVAAQSPQVDLQSGQEQQERQAEDRENLYRKVDLDPAEHTGPDDHTDDDLDERPRAPVAAARIRAVAAQQPRSQKRKQNHKNDQQVVERNLRHCGPHIRWSAVTACVARRERRTGSIAVCLASDANVSCAVSSCPENRARRRRLTETRVTPWVKVGLTGQTGWAVGDLGQHTITVGSSVMFSPRKIRGVVISGVAVVAALTLTTGQSAAASGCFTVSGRYTEHAVTGRNAGRRWDCALPAPTVGTFRVRSAGVPMPSRRRLIRPPPPC